MADNIIRLRVDSAEYDQKLRKASDGLTSYYHQCRKAGQGLADANRETLSFVQSIGQMGTASKTAAGSFSEMKKVFTDLSMLYGRLTKEERATPFGQALSTQLGELRSRIGDTGQQLNAIRQEIDSVAGTTRTAAQGMEQFKAATDGVNGTVVNLAAKLSALQNSYAAWQGLVSVMNEYMSVAGAQSSQELKLKTIMQERMSATEADVQGIKDLAAAQQEVGVVSDAVQLAGAQQVATFLSEADAIRVLLPAMNDLAVQRQGMNVTQEEMVSIGNLVGKVMQGQTSALKRVGITFDEAQEQILKAGNEMERAGMLAEVITKNVGKMNTVMGATCGGKTKQMANAFQDVQESIGRALAQYKVFINSIGMIGMAVTGIASMYTAVSGLAKAIGLASVAQKVWAGVTASFTALQTLCSAALNGTTLSAQALTVAIRGSIAAMGIIGVVAVVIGQLASSLIDMTSASDSASASTKNLTAEQRALQTAAASAAAAQKEAQKKVSAAVGELVGKYQTLRGEWQNLRTEAAQNAWIKKNQDAFAALGMSVNSVNSAYNYFVKNSSNVIAALSAIARADALKDILKDQYKEFYRIRGDKSVGSGGSYHVVKAGDSTDGYGGDLMSLIRELGMYNITDAADHGYIQFENILGTAVRLASVSQAGADEINRRRRAEAARTKKVLLDEQDALIRGTARELASAESDVTRLSAKAGIDPNRPVLSQVTPTKTGTGRGHTGTTSTTTTTATVDTRSEMEKNSDKIQALAKDYVEAADSVDVFTAGISRYKEEGKDTTDLERQLDLAKKEKDEIRSQIQALQQRNEILQSYEDAALGKGQATSTAPAGSLKALQDQLKDLQQQQQLVTSHEEWKRFSVDIDNVNKKIKALTTDAEDLSTFTLANVTAFTSDKQKTLQGEEIGSEAAQQIARSIGNATALRNAVQEALNAGMDVSGLRLPDVWSQILAGEHVDADIQHIIDHINEYLSDAELPTISVDVATGTLKRATKQTLTLQEKFQAAAQAVQTMGSAMQGIENPAAKVSGIIAAAIAQISLGFAQAVTASAKEGVWAWIAAATAGLATTISTIGSIKSATRAAEGGIISNGGGFAVPGTAFSGDRVPALLNSGELVLNRAQQGNLASQLDSVNSVSSARPYVTGETLYLGINNYMRRSGMGEIVGSRG